MSSFWYFWLPAIVVVSILLGLCEYSRWQWASRIMAQLERHQDPIYKRGLIKKDRFK